MTQPPQIAGNNEIKQDKRWHVALEQVLSEYITKRYEKVITSNNEADAIKGVLERAYEIDVFSPRLRYKVLHVIRWI